VQTCLNEIKGMFETVRLFLERYAGRHEAAFKGRSGHRKEQERERSAEGEGGVYVREVELDSRKKSPPKNKKIFQASPELNYSNFSNSSKKSKKKSPLHLHERVTDNRDRSVRTGLAGLYFALALYFSPSAGSRGHSGRHSSDCEGPTAKDELRYCGVDFHHTCEVFLSRQCRMAHATSLSTQHR
jgi:hypothetical protein